MGNIEMQQISDTYKIRRDIHQMNTSITDQIALLHKMIHDSMQLIDNRLHIMEQQLEYLQVNLVIHERRIKQLQDTKDDINVTI